MIKLAQPQRTVLILSSLLAVSAMAAPIALAQTVTGKAGSPAATTTAGY